MLSARLSFTRGGAKVCLTGHCAARMGILGARRITRMRVVAGNSSCMAARLHNK